MTLTVDELADQIGAECRGDGHQTITGCAPLDAAGPEEVSFLANGKYVRQLAGCEAGAVILDHENAKQATERTLLVASDPYYAFRNAMVTLHGFRHQPEAGISDRAMIAPTAQLGEDCHIGAFVVIEDGAVLGDRCAVYPNCHIGAQAQLGEDCVLHPQVTVYDRCVLGDRVTLHSGCVIGQDGFGYATHQGAHHKIPQAGRAVVGDDVEMGANCSVDRATLGDTVIGEGTKFSNSVTIGHGTKVGRHNLFVAQVGLAGSVKTGDYVALGGQVGVAGHLHIGDQAQVAGHSGVMNNIPAKVNYGGAPAQPLKDLFRMHAQLRKLPELSQTVKSLAKRLTQLEAAANHDPQHQTNKSNEDAQA
jgi:UDP-3-O-[3-hydroxymyristoyl] glucosamine N-acyltransferase